MTLPCRSFERRRGSRPSSGGFRRARLFFLRRRGTIAARKQGGTAMEKQPQLHTIAPVYDENSRILILGSFPSVKSREAAFFYGHPQNRFWRVLAAATSPARPTRASRMWCQTTSRAFWTPRRSAASSATAARPTAFTAGMTRPYGERRRLCPPPVPPTRARPCRRSRSAGARRSRHGFDGSAPMKNVTLTC